MHRIFAFTTACLLLVSSTSPARAVEFDVGRAGNYRGLWAISSSDGSAYTAFVNGSVSVSPGGDRLRLQFRGRVNVGGDSLPVATTLRFGPGRRLRANSPILGFGGPAATAPARFGGRTALRATLRARAGARLMGQDLTGTAIRYRFRASPRRFLIEGAGNIVQDGDVIPIRLRASLDKRG